MIKVLCDKCGAELTQQGALIFSYPGDYDTCFKYHVCRDCWHNELLTWFDKEPKEQPKP